MSNVMTTGCARTEQVLDLEAWCAKTLGATRERRQHLEQGLADLRHFIEGDGAADPDLKRSENVCQRTRMLIDDGETLHFITHLYVLLSHRPVPAEAWDADLAAEARRLLELAPGAVSVPQWRKNCQERLAYAQTRWQDWLSLRANR